MWLPEVVVLEGGGGVKEGNQNVQTSSDNGKLSTEGVMYNMIDIINTALCYTWKF